MGILRVGDPSEEPVTSAEVKTWARITGTDLDTPITYAITEARADFEHLTGRIIAQRTVKLLLDAFPAEEIDLQVAPPLTVSQVRYLDVNAAWQVIGSSNYTISKAFGDVPVEAWLLPADDYDWPDTDDIAECVEVTMSVGYTQAGCPQDIKGWIARQAALRVWQRTDVDLRNDLTIARWNRHRF